LKCYCVAAAAAGVGILALAEPSAQAEIIYTPAQKSLLFENWTKVDLNHDGIADVSFLRASSNYKVLDRTVLAAAAQSQGGVVGYLVSTHQYGSALPKGASIGPKRNFLNREAVLVRTEISHYFCCNTVYAGQWRNVREKFLGVKFLIDGEIHYGWVRLSIGGSVRLQGVITGYAYETVANRPIAAGETTERTSDDIGPSTFETNPEAAPSTAENPRIFPRQAYLGLLAVGVAGLDLGRP
jgi:hypothetical protein